MEDLDSLLAGIGGANNDTLVEVVSDMITEGCEDEKRNLIRCLHQLSREIEKEQRQRDTLMGQIDSTEKVIRSLADFKTTEAAMLVSVLQSRVVCLQARLSELKLTEKVKRKSRLRANLEGIEGRAAVAAKMMACLRPNRVQGVTE